MKYSVKKMVGTSLATTAALAAFATTNVSADELYTIESGDTLTAISRKFDLSVADLVEANTIENQDLIITGKSLTIPTVDQPVVADSKRVADASNVYTVVEGDTLNKIAADFDTTAQNLRDLNGISGDLILVGQKLTVKGEAAPVATEEAPVAEEATEVVEETPVVEETSNAYVADENGNYTVVAGDSINKISSKFGVSASELRAANNLSGDLILVGQQLAIPGLAAVEVAEEAPVVEETAEVVEEAPVVEETAEVVEEAPAVEETVEAVEAAPVVEEIVEVAEETPVIETAAVEAEEATVETVDVEAEAQAAAEAETAAQAEAEAQAAAEAEAEAEAQAAAETEAAAQAEAEAQAAAEAEAAAQAEAEAQAAAEAEAAAQAEAEAQAAAEAESAQSGNVTALLNNAYAQVGVPYVWGGKSPSGFDCSGFVNYVYNQTYGVNVGWSTASQQYAGPQISVSNAQPGDLIFWGSYGSPYHVAISLGNGQYIHSQRPGETVHSESINPYWAPSFAVSMAAYN